VPPGRDWTLQPDPHRQTSARAKLHACATARNRPTCRKDMRAHPILQMVMNRAHLQIHRFDRAKCPLQRVQAEGSACDGWCFGPDRCVCAHAHQTAGAPAGCFEPRLVAPQLIAGCARSISASGGFLRMAVRPHLWPSYGPPPAPACPCCANCPFRPPARRYEKAFCAGTCQLQQRWHWQRRGQPAERPVRQCLWGRCLKE
jgi:hypothetical protein